MSSTQQRQFGAPVGSSGLLRGGPLVLGVVVSALVSEAHEFSSNATKIALESGAQVTDHVIVDPDRVSIVFSMANAGSGAEEARDALETFKAMQEDRELLELITEHRVYKDMVITGISPYHTAPFRGALSFTINLQQINFVKLEATGRVSVGKGAASKTAAGKENAGQQNPQPVDERTGLQKLMGTGKE